MPDLRLDWPKSLALGAGAIAGALGVSVLVAWHFHFTPVIQVRPTLAPMHRMTALELVLGGIALCLMSAGRKRAARVFALAMLVPAALVALEYVLQADFGIDQLLGRDDISPPTSHPGRLSPVTTLCFLAGSLSLVVISSRTPARYASAIAGTVSSALIAVGAVTVLAYLGHTQAYGWGHFSRVAIHTGAGHALLGAGLMALAWRERPAREGLPQWVPLSVGLGIAVAVLGVWQALMVHEESMVLLLSSIVLAGGILLALLLALAVHLAQKSWNRSQELQEGKAILEGLFEGAPDALLVTDLQGRITSANQRVESAFGYIRDELLGQPIESLVPVKLRDLHRVHRVGYYSLPSTRPMGKGLEPYARRKDGSEFPVEIYLSPLRLDGEIQVLAVVRDITERKQAQEALRQSEERFRGLFEQGPVGVTLMGTDYHLAKVNAAFCRMMGYSEAELTSMTPFDITYPDDRDPTVNLVEQLFKTEIPVHKIEKRYVKKSGEVIWGSLTAAVIHDREGKPLYGMGMIEDITERKRAEEELRTLSERLSLATRIASIGVWDWDLRTNLEVWDDAAFEMFDLPKVNPLRHEDFVRRVHPDDLPKVEAATRRMIHEKTQVSEEFRIIRSDGSLRYLSVAAGAVADEQGNVSRAVGIAVDITERKQMEAQIEASRQQMLASARLSALGMMAGGVAHEINNPLSIIHALASDLIDMVEEKGSAPPQMVERNSARIRETAERIARIVRSLRKISREGSSDKFHPVRIGKILEETLEICKERFKAYSVKLLLPEPIPELSVSCREVQIEQVLLNLLQNAFDAVAEQDGERWVRVDVASRNGSAVISVTDNGPGIPAQLQSRIGEPFFTTKAVGKGTGLGLSLSKTIAEEHGGRIEYARENGHTCFSLVLPQARQAEAA